MPKAEEAAEAVSKKILFFQSAPPLLNLDDEYIFTQCHEIANELNAATGQDGFRTAKGVWNWIRSDLLDRNSEIVMSTRYQPVEVDIMRQAVGTSIKVSNKAKYFY